MSRGFTLTPEIATGAEEAFKRGGAQEMYRYLIQQGDGYAMLAYSVVGGNPSQAGVASVDYLNNAALNRFNREGAGSDPNIIYDMANGYLGIIKDAVKDGKPVDNFELDYEQGYALHEKVFKDNKLDITVWSMHALIKHGEKAAADAFWKRSIDITKSGSYKDSTKLSVDIYIYMQKLKEVYIRKNRAVGGDPDLRAAIKDIEEWDALALRTFDDVTLQGIKEANSSLYLKIFENLDTFFVGSVILWLDLGLKDFNPWRSILNAIMRFATYDNAPAPRDPLILDLNGDGISTIASGGNTGQKFDFNDDGLKTAAGWVAPTDGILGIDLNGDGKLTSGKELMGDQTVLKDGRIAKDGYEALADLDSNGDGVINALDADYHKLRVWMDKNGDGISQADELHTLAALGVVGLNLENKMTSETLNGNNILSHIGSFIKADGTTGTMGNVNFMPDDLYAEYEEKIFLTPEQAAMSKIAGLGRVRPLAEALTLSFDLKYEFEVYRACLTKAEQLEALEDLLWAWAETDPKFQRVIFRDAEFVLGSTNAVGSGGGGPGGEINLRPDPLLGRWGLAEIKVSIMNSFFNLEYRSFYKLPSDYNSTTKTWSNQAANTSTLDTIDRIYNQLTSNMYMELLVETRMSPYLHQITVTDAGLDFTKVIAMFDQVAMINTRKAFVDLAEFITLFEDKRSVLGLISALDRYAQMGAMSEGIDDWMKELSAEVDAVKKLGLVVGALDNYIISGSTGNDIILGNFFGKQINASNGDDIIVVSSSGNIVDAGAGNDTIIISSDNNIIDASAGNDTILISSGTNNVVNAGSGNNVITVTSDGQNSISSSNGNDTIKLGSGDSNVFSGAGNDTIYSGSGNDRLEGGTGLDTYIFSKGHGQDIVSENGDVLASIIDTIKFTDVNSTEVKFARDGNNLIIFGYNGSDQVTVDQFFSDNYYIIERFEFADNAITYNDFWSKGLPLYTLDDVDSIINGWGGANHIQTGAGNHTINTSSGNDVIRLGSGDNIVNAGAGNDTIYSGIGNDFLVGGRGLDTYIFSKGHGQDIVSDNGDVLASMVDTIKFTDVNSTEVKFARDGNNLIIFGYNGSDRVTVDQFFSNNYYIIERFEFADKAITYSDYWSKGLPLYTLNDVDSEITGWGGANHIQTGAGNHTINTNDGHDVIKLGTGNNIVNAGAGNDTIYSGTGNDFLVGGRGLDTYIFSKGHGQDIVSDNGDVLASMVDTIKFTDVNSTEVKFARDGNNLIIFGYNGSDRVTVDQFFSNNYYIIERFEFADKAITYNDYWSKGLPLYTLDDVDSIINGWGGANHVHTGAGNHTINTNDGHDVIKLGLGNNIVNAGAGNDTIYSGTGNDFLVGGRGLDTYIFSKGHGQDIVSDNGDVLASMVDTIKFTDVNSTEVKFARDGNNLIIFGYNGSDRVTVDQFFSNNYYIIERFEFADNAITYNDYWSKGLPLYALDDVDSVINGWGGANHVHTGAGNHTINTNSGNDVIRLGSGDNIVNTGAGNDTIYSGTGNDSLVGGTGADTYIFSKGHGQDIVSENGDVLASIIDTIKFTDVNSTEVKFARDGNNLIIFGYNGSDRVTVDQFFSNNYYIIERFEFADKALTYAQLIKTTIPAFTAEDQAALLTAQVDLDAMMALNQVMSPASYLMMDELFEPNTSPMGLSALSTPETNQSQADIAKEVQSLISAMASFGATEGSVQIDDQNYGGLTLITVPN